MSIDISALNILDYAIIIILVVSAILSTLRGMTREALGLVGWPIAIFAAKYSAPVIEPMIVSVIKVGGIGQALSWALPFAVVVVLWFVIASVLAPGLKRAGLGALDRWLGVIFGLIRGYVIVLLTYAVAVVIMEGENNLPKQVGEAAFNPYVRASVISLSAMAPDDMRSRILDNVPSAPDVDIEDAASDLAEFARDTARETVADPAKDAAGAVANETTTNFNLLEDEAKSQ
jgi:membrane protein required for colicin V production